MEDFNDWEKNIYFNCSSPSTEKCGVPFSCCKASPDVSFVCFYFGYFQFTVRIGIDLVRTPVVGSLLLTLQELGGVFGLLVTQEPGTLTDP